MKLFKDYNFVVVPIKGKSMFPYLREGDKVLASFLPVDTEDLDIGQLALYFDCGELTIHRLIKNSKSKVFKADRGLNLERPMKILGKCVGVIRKDKNIFYKKNMILPKIISQLSAWHYQGKQYFLIRRIFVFLIIFFSEVQLVKEIILGGTKSIFDRS